MHLPRTVIIITTIGHSIRLCISDVFIGVRIINITLFSCDSINLSKFINEIGRG